MNLEPKRQDAILNAALKEFTTKGFDDASTNVIAKESGISKGLLFHYIPNKKDFFLFLYDYCTQIIKEEYFNLINLNEKDIFERLRQIYLLKMEMLHKYPWIFEFTRVAAYAKSNEINKELKERYGEIESESYETTFGNIDESQFKEELNVERCKQLIFWSIVGFSNQMLEDIKDSKLNELDYNKILAELDDYLNELRKSFYKRRRI